MEGEPTQETVHIVSAILTVIKRYSLSIGYYAILLHHHNIFG